jgi:hypothetical protein
MRHIGFRVWQVPRWAYVGLVAHTAQYLQVAPDVIFVRIYIPRRNILVHRHTWRPTPVTYCLLCVQTWRTSVKSKWWCSATTRDKPNWPNFDAYSCTKVEAFVMLAILWKPRKSMKNLIWHNGIQFMNLFVVYLTTLFSNLDYIASNERVISKWWIGKDVERSDHGLISGANPAFSWSDWGNSQKTVMKPGLRTENWTLELSNMKQEC